MALKLFAATGAAFLLGIVSLGLSGGGLSHGVLAEPLNAIFVVVTWLAWLALVPLLIAASVSAVVSLVSRPDAPNQTESSWPARDFTRPAWVGTTPSSGEPTPRGAGQARPTGVLVVLLIMAAGGIVLFVRAAQRPAPDDVGLGLLLLAVGIVAWLLIVGTRLAKYLRQLVARYRRP